MHNNIDFIAYYFSKNEGVGVQRARYLYKFLQTNGYLPILHSSDTFGYMAKRSKFLWGIILLIKLIFSKNKKLYATCGPFWFLPIIWLIGKLRKTKLIYDFRDPWSFNIERGYGNINKRGNHLKILISRFIEKNIYNDCFSFWVCTPGMYELYRNLFKDDTKLKFVPNGYEFTRDEIINNNENVCGPLKNAIKIVCLGRMAVHGISHTKKLFSEINGYIKENKNKSISIQLIGTEKDEIEKIVSDMKLDKIVTFLPKQDHKKALGIAVTSDVGICLVRDENYELGTKAFDYIGLGIPILDIFDHTKNFYNYFKEYIIKIEDIEYLHKYSPPKELYRGYIFKSVLESFN